MHLFSLFFNKSIRFWLYQLSQLSHLTILGCAAALVACGGGGGGDGGTPSADPVKLKSNVSGMKSLRALLLKNQNNSEELIISDNGTYSFNVPLYPNDSYKIAVIAQPTGQTCSVNHNEGVIVAGSPAPTVEVNCNSLSYTVGGTVNGLQLGEQLTLSNNGIDFALLTGDAADDPLTYSFNDPVAFDSPFNVTVVENPDDQVCTIAKAGGYTGTNFGNNNVNDVNFLCDSLATARTISGTVKGLSQGTEMVIQNNGGDNQTITSNGTFAFDNKVANRSSFDVRILVQPSDQVCTVQNGFGEGRAIQRNVSNIIVSCGDDDRAYTISGKVSGWNGSEMVLKNTKTNSYAKVAADGTFAFPPVISESPYEIITSTFPVLQDCSVANETGTVWGDLVLSVSCTDATTVKTIYTFSNDSDIVGYPVGLIEDGNGNLVGISTVQVNLKPRADEKYNTGNIFKIPLQGAQNADNLCTFRGISPDRTPTYDASYPTGLALGRDNHIYVTAFLGGPCVSPSQEKDVPPPPETQLVGGIYQFNASTLSSASILHRFPCTPSPLLSLCANNVAPVAELIQDTDGYFYGVAYGYALRAIPSQGGQIYKMAANGAFQALHNFTFANGATDGLHPNGKLTLVDGYLYGTTEKGGRFGKGTIFRISVNGTAFEAIYHFNDGIFPAHPGIGVTNDRYPDGIYLDPYANPYSGLVPGRDGNLYGVAKYGGDNNAGWIFRVTLSFPAVVEKLYSFPFNNNPTTELIQLNDGNFYGTTEKGGTHAKGSIFRFTPQGGSGTLTTLHNFLGNTGEGDGNTPSTRLVAGRDGNLYGGTRFGGGENNQGAIFKMGRN